MFKNIIFDLGNVFFYWNPELFFEKLDLDETSKEILRKEVLSKWDLMDYGMDGVDFINMFNNKLPENISFFPSYIVNNWPKLVSANYFSKMFDLKRELLKNHKVYILSNIPDDIKYNLSLFKLDVENDGCVFSGVEKLHKPDKDIYELILNRYNLKAEECLFVDDKLDNVIGARSVGMNAYQFDIDKYEEFVSYLKENKDI